MAAANVALLSYALTSTQFKWLEKISKFQRGLYRYTAKGTAAGKTVADHGFNFKGVRIVLFSRTYQSAEPSQACRDIHVVAQLVLHAAATTFYKCGVDVRP